MFGELPAYSCYQTTLTQWTFNTKVQEAHIVTWTRGDGWKKANVGDIKAWSERKLIVMS